jgi:AraC-like DNA-binding protein
MINLMDMDEICLRLELASARSADGAERRSLPANKTSAQRGCQLAAVDGLADGTRTTNGHQSQREAKRIMERALTYMTQNLDKPIQMPTLGTLAGVSMSHFYHLFKLATGETPNQFLIRARIHRAGALLRETDLSVKEVSAALGYDDPFYFSRLFKLVNGVSPREYRVTMAGLEYTQKNTARERYARTPLESFVTSSPRPQQVRQHRSTPKSYTQQLDQS